MKKILFDLDNTLIEFKDEYWNTIDDTFKFFKLSCDENLRKKFISAVNKYEKKVIRFNIEEMTSFISNDIKIKLPDNFIGEWKKRLSKCVPDVDNELIEVFKYLSSKYDLYIITNWFTDQQTERIKNISLLPYFKEIVGCDKMNLKPDKEMYYYFLKDCSNSDIIVVGDNYNYDIKPAIDLGIYSYLVTQEVKKTKDNLYGVIKNVKELKEIL